MASGGQPRDGHRVGSNLADASSVNLYDPIPELTESFGWFKLACVRVSRVAAASFVTLAVLGGLRATLPAKAGRAANPPPKTLSKLCGLPYVKAAVVQFPASDGARLVGAVAGKGKVGVVVANTHDTGICTWVVNGRRTIDALVAAGNEVLLFDYRSTGFSPKAQGKAAGEWQDRDVLGAAAELRRLGASQVVLAGASIGGIASLLAATTLKPAPAAVIGLSASGVGPTETSLLRTGTESGATAAAKIRTPLLLVVAKDDTYASARNLFKASRAADKQLLVVPGQTHGFFDNDPAGAKIRTRILKFVQAHTHG